MRDNTYFLSNISSALYTDKKRSSIGISCQAPLSIWVLVVLMLVIITIVISPLVIKFFKYRWWNVHRTLETQEEG